LTALRLIFFIAFIVLPVGALADTFRSRLSRRTKIELPKWRSNALSVGMWLAALAQVFVLAFLIQGFHPDRQSFGKAAPMIWREINSISLFSWILVVAAVALGKGLGKRSLVAWIVTLPLAVYIIVMIGFHH
jgi:hypothetical protein